MVSSEKKSCFILSQASRALSVNALPYTEARMLLVRKNRGEFHRAGSV